MELIGIRGVLEGIKNMLITTDKDTIDLLKTRMDCAQSMLGGVIKELTPLPETLFADSGSIPSVLDKEAQIAKKELS